MPRSLSVGCFSAILGLRRFAAENGPFDIVHCQSTVAGFYGRIALANSGAKLAYSPRAFLSRDPSSSRIPRWIAGRYERIMSFVTDLIIAVSTDEFDHARQLGIAEHRLGIVHNGIRPTEATVSAAGRNEWRQRLGLSDRSLCIGCVGRLVRQKGVDMLLSACASVVGAPSHHVVLTVVGDGPLREQLEGRAIKLGMAEHIRWVQSDHALEVMQAFDIFALPSRYEGFPNVLLEAMALGLPCVSTAVGGSTDAIINGVSGYLVPVDDAAAFGDRLAALLCNRGLRERLGGAGRQTILSHFTREKSLSAALRHYEALLGHKSPASLPTATHDGLLVCDGRLETSDARR